MPNSDICVNCPDQSTHPRITIPLKISQGYGIQIGHDVIYTFMNDANRERLADWATNDNCAMQVGAAAWSDFACGMAVDDPWTALLLIRKMHNSRGTSSWGFFPSSSASLTPSSCMPPPRNGMYVYVDVGLWGPTDDDHH